MEGVLLDQLSRYASSLTLDLCSDLHEVRDALEGPHLVFYATRADLLHYTVRIWTLHLLLHSSCYHWRSLAYDTRSRVLRND